MKVNDEKINDWCDAKKIRLDTQKGCYNVDKLLKGEFLSSGEKKEWAMFEKKYKRDIDNGPPGGEMNQIRRFKGKYGAKGFAGPSSVRGRKTRVTREPPVVLGPPVVHMVSPGAWPHFHFDCMVCHMYGRYCGDPLHRDG